MKKTKNKNKVTTVAADDATRDALKKLAEKMGISQRKCIALVVDEWIHRDTVNQKKKGDEFGNLDTQSALNQIDRRLQKIEKRENPRDTIVSFFKTQEKEILKPMSLQITTISAKLQETLAAINNL
jgi:predicted transcriptional regulator